MNDNVIVLQYTTLETAGDDEGPYSEDSLKSYDESAAQGFVLSSDKLENNFTQVYFSNFMN